MSSVIVRNVQSDTVYLRFCVVQSVTLTIILLSTRVTGISSRVCMPVWLRLPYLEAAQASELRKLQSCARFRAAQVSELRSLTCHFPDAICRLCCCKTLQPLNRSFEVERKISQMYTMLFADMRNGKVCHECEFV